MEVSMRSFRMIAWTVRPRIAIHRQPMTILRICKRMNVFVICLRVIVLILEAHIELCEKRKSVGHINSD